MGEGEWKPADDCDVWLRALTDRKHVYEKTEDGRSTLSLHNRALKGKAIGPPTEKRPWSIEVSGKLLSLIANVVSEGESFIEQIKATKPDAVFQGYAYSTVGKIREVRLNFPHPSVDVMATPKANNPTHADAVMNLDSEASGDDLEKAKSMLRDWLQEVLEVVRPNEACERLEALRPPSEPGTSDVEG